MLKRNRQQAANTRRLLSAAVIMSALMNAAPVKAQAILIVPPRPQQPISQPVIPIIMAPEAPPSPPPMPINNNNVAPIQNVFQSPKINNINNYPILVPTDISIKIPIKTPKTPKKPKPSKHGKGKVDETKSESAAQATVQPIITSKPQAMAPLPGIFHFSMDCGNGLCNENNQFEMIPGRGALYSMESSDSVHLAMGHMLVIAGEVAVSFKAGRLNATVVPGCAMAAEVLPDGTTKMYSLPAFEKTHGTCLVQTPAEMGGKEITLADGQEIILSAQAMSDQELIAVDGVALGPVEGGLTVGDHLHLVRYSTKKMQENQIMIGCRMVTIPPTERLLKVRQAVTQSAAEESDSPQVDKHLQAVALSQSAAASTAQSQPQVILDNKGSTVFAEAGSIVESQDSDGKLQLIKGSLLARSHGPLEISSFGASVSVSRGAVALVKAQDHFLKVVNLTDTASNSIQIRVGTDTLSLIPGHEVVLSDRAPSLAHIFDVHQIGHRTIVSRQLKDQMWATTSEIALADEIIYQPLMHWVRINHVAHGLPMVNQVVKTAAVLQTISRSGEYVRGETDDEVETTGIASHACSSCTH